MTELYGTLGTLGKLRKTAAGMLLALCVASVASAQIPCRYDVEFVPNPPPCGFGIPNASSAQGISPNGRYVVGVFGQCDLYGESFVWDRQTGQYTKIIRPQGVYDSGAVDVNDAGLVAGVYWRTPQNAARGYIYNVHTQQYVAELGPAQGGFGECWINAINSSGVVCGTRSIGPDPFPRSAFIWSADKGFIDVGMLDNSSTWGLDINARSQVAVATATAVPGYYGYLWDGRSLTQLVPPSPAVYSSARSITDSGQVLVQASKQSRGELLARAYIFDHGSWTELIPLPGFTRSGGWAISKQGMVVGSSNNVSPGQRRASRWVNGIPQDLNALSNSDLPGILDYAVAINLRSEIIAWGQGASIILRPANQPLGDTNCDNAVNIDDLFNVINAWGPCFGCYTDLNGDGVVNLPDLIDVIVNWD